jgi:hypothetical protein
VRFRGFAALYASATIFAFVTLSMKFASRYNTGLFVSGSSSRAAHATYPFRSANARSSSQ